MCDIAPELALMSRVIKGTEGFTINPSVPFFINPSVPFFPFDVFPRRVTAPLAIGESRVISGRVVNIDRTDFDFGQNPPRIRPTV